MKLLLDAVFVENGEEIVEARVGNDLASVEILPT